MPKGYLVAQLHVHNMEKTNSPVHWQDPRSSSMAALFW